MLAFMSVTGYAGMANLQRLEVALIPPAEVYAGQPAPLVVLVTNRKRHLSSFLLTFTCDGGRTSLAHLPAAATVRLPFELTFSERGRVRVPYLQVRSPFPVAFFVRSWRLQVDCELLVYPQLRRCAGLGSSDDGAHLAEGRRDQRGSAGEVERIADYTGRESLRQIHWRLSARSEEFKVKEYRAAAAEPLVIDLARLSGGMEERISCAAWLVHHWTPNRPVGLRLGEELIPPLAGRHQMQRLLSALALYKGTTSEVSAGSSVHQAGVSALR